jgi:hypothetical protein
MCLVFKDEKNVVRDGDIVLYFNLQISNHLFKVVVTARKTTGNWPVPSTLAVAFGETGQVVLRL